MAAVLVFSSTFLLALYFLARKKGCRFEKTLDRKHYPLQDSFMPMALLLLQRAGYQYRSAYDQKVLVFLNEIYGYKEAHFYLKVFWCQKIAYYLLGVEVAALLGFLWGEAGTGFFLFYLGAPVGLFLIPDFELKNQVKKRHTAIRLDFPDFINKLVLLINAGLNVRNAWEKAVISCPRVTPLYQEAEKVLQNIRSGLPEIQSYEEFARRCCIPEITKFVAVIIQNHKRGQAELAFILRQLAAECWEIRKQTVRRLGEEASTKLLFPMMLMLLAILLIAALPAVLALKEM